MLFTMEGNDANAEKSFSLFMRNVPAKLPDNQRLTHFELSGVLVECVKLIAHKKESPSVLMAFITERSSEIRQKAEELLEVFRSYGTSIPEKYLVAIDYLHSLEPTDFDNHGTK